MKHLVFIILLLFCCTPILLLLAAVTERDGQFCSNHADCVDTNFCHFPAQDSAEYDILGTSSSSSSHGICTCNPTNHNGCVRGLETCDYVYSDDVFGSGMPTCGLDIGAACSSSDSTIMCHSQYCHDATNTCTCNPNTQVGCPLTEVCVLNADSPPACTILEKRSLHVGMPCVVDSQCVSDYCFKTSNNMKVCTCNPYSNQGCEVYEQCAINRVVELSEERVDSNTAVVPSCFSKIEDSCVSNSDCFTSNCWKGACVCETKLHSGCDRRFEMCVGDDESGYQCVARPQDDPLLGDGDGLEKQESGGVGIMNGRITVVIVATMMAMNVFV